MPATETHATAGGQPTDSPDRIVQSLLDRWADGIVRHAPQDVADLFTDDALFQGFDPEPGRGRDFVAAYYDKQPLGLAVDAELLQTRRLGPRATLGFLRAVFHRPEGDVPVHLTVVAESSPSGWRLSHYHVSRGVTA